MNNRPLLATVHWWRQAACWALLAAGSVGIARAQMPTTRYEYDALGNPTRTLAPLGRTTTTAYDALHRPTQTLDAAGGMLRQRHDAFDRLTGVIDPRNLVTEYRFNGLGDLVRQSSPDTGTTQYTHDEAGNVLTRTDAKGQVTRYQYDALNRPILVMYHDGSRVVRGWDAAGRLALLVESDAAGQVVRSGAFGYDVQGRLVQEIRVVGARTFITGYLWGNGRLAGVLYPSGRLVSYDRDAAGRIVGISSAGPDGSARTVLGLVQYHSFGGVRSFVHGNGIACARPLDAAGRLIGYSLGGVPQGVSYDSASRVVVQGDSGYGFDDLDRVVAAVSALGAQGYAYDANGNRTAMTLGATVFPYAVDPASNRLVSVGGPSGWALGHDANGSVVSDGARHFAYDARGRLVRVERGAVATAFEVDARGLRVRKSGPLGERFFHYDSAGRLIAESDANGSFDREYLYLDALPVALLADGAMYHIDTDHLGTPRWLSNGAGNNVWRWLPGEPFGIQAPAEDPSLSGFPFVFNLRFPGQYFDGETLLHYNFHRDYDPATGRYIQSDPIGLAGGVNTYTYVGGNPVSFTDLRGLASSGQPTNLGGGTNVRIDNPHIPGQQQHAHVETLKGKVVVNQDGTQSHKEKGSLDNLTKKAKDFLKGKGFKNPGIPVFLDPCLLDPYQPFCPQSPLNCPGT